MNINRYALCKERSLQKIISKQPKPNTTAIGVCSETQVTHHIITKRSDECLPISAYVTKHKEGDGKKFPVIIDIYGGDFVAGRSALNRNFGTWCAEHGYLTFIPEYTPVPETNLFLNILKEENITYGYLYNVADKLWYAVDTVQDNRFFVLDENFINAHT